MGEEQWCSTGLTAGEWPLVGIGDNEDMQKREKGDCGRGCRNCLGVDWSGKISSEKRGSSSPDWLGYIWELILILFSRIDMKIFIMEKDCRRKRVEVDWVGEVRLGVGWKKEGNYNRSDMMNLVFSQRL